ncbi:MAG: hypothetical protein IPI49_14475 [Myxococcales bacterium]|nr:hypothetical protein [Myxococcales bacterium]
MREHWSLVARHRHEVQRELWVVPWGELQGHIRGEPSAGRINGDGGLQVTRLDVREGMPRQLGPQLEGLAADKGSGQVDDAPAALGDLRLPDEPERGAVEWREENGRPRLGVLVVAGQGSQQPLAITEHGLLASSRVLERLLGLRLRHPLVLCFLQQAGSGLRQADLWAPGEQPDRHADRSEHGQRAWHVA